MLNAWYHCYHGTFSYFPGHVTSSSLSSSPTVLFYLFFFTQSTLNTVFFTQKSEAFVNGEDSFVLSICSHIGEQSNLLSEGAVLIVTRLYTILDSHADNTSFL